MKKKFRVRVKHFLRESYIVQYAHYLVIPNWKTLNRWDGLFHPDRDLACWTYNLLNYGNAEKLARSIQGIEDVKSYYKTHELERKQYWIDEKKWWKINAPYTEKRIY